MVGESRICHHCHHVQSDKGAVVRMLAEAFPKRVGSKSSASAFHRGSPVHDALTLSITLSASRTCA